MWELTPQVVDSLQMLGLAFVLSTVIGAEREYHHKDAGLRTHILVGLGSALFTRSRRTASPSSPGTGRATRAGSPRRSSPASGSSGPG